MLGDYAFWHIAISDDFPGFALPSPMYGSGRAWIYDWEVVSGYNGRLGLLSYHADPSGTCIIALDKNLCHYGYVRVKLSLLKDIRFCALKILKALAV